MRILGLNMSYSLPKEATPTGLRHHLSDGSAALVEDGAIAFAAIEERHTRRRYEGGFGNTVCRFWECEGNITPSPVDAIAISSCCGPRWTASQDVVDEIEEGLPPGLWTPTKGPLPKLLVVDHHESHAALGFALSGAEKALVAVLDGFGNLIDPEDWNPDQWWRGSFQRHSYYLATRTEGGFHLKLVSRDAEGLDDVGFGEAYRAITHFCGWRSYQQAGSAMALAAYGDPARFAGIPFIQCDDRGIVCGLPNEHPNPIGVIEDILRRHGTSVQPLVGRTATPADDDHCAVVRAVQDQLVESLCTRLLGLADSHEIETIVVSGGAAMNCLAMGQLQRRFRGRIFVPPAPSDTGQGLGNAIWAAHCTSSPLFRPDGPALDTHSAPFWGIPANGVAKAVRRLRQHENIRVEEDLSPQEHLAQAARLLAEGRLVAVAMGRSEYGPRALGRRSVLFDPRCPDAAEQVNRFKRRESYRPFAPAILEEHVDDFCAWSVHSPFMSFAVEIKPNARARIPGVLHADGTARIQTVGPQSDSPLRVILEAFHSITGVPVLLNTSFNRKGEPMVETPFEAVDAFLNSPLDALLLDGLTITKNNIQP
jgi:carbamoyltransferase